jgi:hypothetical protein
MEEELCLVNNCATNSILRETKYFQTLTKRTENILIITGCKAGVVGSVKATITLPMSTQITIKNALLYPDSTRTLLSDRDIRKNELHIILMRRIMRNFSSLINLTEMAMIFLNEYFPYNLDCTTHT